jgi:hypothetical protein
VVVHTASVTATRLMLAVLANATVAAEGRTTLVAALLETSRHLRNQTAIVHNTTR